MGNKYSYRWKINTPETEPYTPTFNFILDNYIEAGATNTEMMFVLILAMHTHESKKGMCNISLTTIAEKLGLKYRATVNIKNNLKQKRLIKVKEIDGKRSVYDISPIAKKCKLIQDKKNTETYAENCTCTYAENCTCTYAEKCTPPMQKNAHEKETIKIKLNNKINKDMPKINFGLTPHNHTDLLNKFVFIQEGKEKQLKEAFVVKVNQKTLKVVIKENNKIKNLKPDSVFYPNGGPGLSPVQLGQPEQPKIPADVLAMRKAVMALLPEFHKDNPVRPKGYIFKDISNLATSLLKNEETPEKVAEFSHWYSNIYWEGIKGNPLSIAKIGRLWPEFQKWLDAGKPSQQEQKRAGSRQVVGNIDHLIDF